MTFTPEQQDKHRTAFIEDCRQKAWGARCHADWIVKQLDQLTAEYTKLKAQDDTLAAEIKALETAVDAHTKDNREQRKALQERRNALVPVQNHLAENMRRGQEALNGLYQSVEASLELAKHAERWSWSESISQSSDPAPEMS